MILGSRHELLLSNVELSSRSLKEYNCTATNHIASASARITVTGKAVLSFTVLLSAVQEFDYMFAKKTSLLGFVQCFFI